MSKSTKYLLTGLGIFVIVNILQLVVWLPFMLAYGNAAILSSFSLAAGKFWVWQANTLPLLIGWCFAFGFGITGAVLELKENQK